MKKSIADFLSFLIMMPILPFYLIISALEGTVRFIEWLVINRRWAGWLMEASWDIELWGRR